jgi:PAP2 superfamily
VLERVRRAVLTSGVHRPSLWTQALVIGALLWAYDAINNLNPIRQKTAIAHGADLIRLELRLHLDPELALNRWLSPHIAFARLVGDYYDTLHFVVTLSVLAWVWWRHPPRYRMLRNALAGINVIGFIVFWLFPVAPPRMLTNFGFVDVIAVTHAIGAWSTGALASQANEFAAMPSLHMAWALWCALAVWCIRKDWPSRVGAVAYVVTTGLVVLSTANHYFLDVTAGLAAALVSAGVAWLWERHRRPGSFAVARVDLATAAPATEESAVLEEGLAAP